MSIEIAGSLLSLRTDHSLYQMKIDENQVLQHVWYGKNLPGDLSYLQSYADLGFSGNPFDYHDKREYSYNTLPMEYPVFQSGDYRPAALQVRSWMGCSTVELKVKEVRVHQGKLDLPEMPHIRMEEGDSTLEVILEDPALGLQVSLYYLVLETQDAIVRWSRIANLSNHPLGLEKALSASLDLPAKSWQWIHFHGRHNRERQFERSDVYHGTQQMDSLRGSSSHQHNPAYVVASPVTTEDAGDCYGMLLMYSGGFCAQVHQDEIDQVRCNIGIHPDTFSWQLEPGESFVTPQALLSFSSDGLNTLSGQYHDLISSRVIAAQDRHMPRPILINNWEATYFNFDGQKILNIASRAKDLGIEMMVLDDGWFGKRENDKSGLGDWTVNEAKLGMSLKQLCRSIHDMGLKFGLWVEPEMISMDSDLYRAHPEFALTDPLHKPHLSRSQLVLNLAKPEVVDYLIETFTALFESAPIDYIKWDMNRSLCEMYSDHLPVHRQKEVSHRYVLGLYRLMGTLKSRFPHILFEGCSGGGGRFDAGILYYMPQIWTSDDTDAYERLKIQYGTSFFYPPHTMGSHVSAVPNHQTGQVYSMETRAQVAYSGTFGYELDLETLSQEEQEQVRKHVREYHALQPLVHFGRYYRLSSPFEDPHVFWQYVSQDKQTALVQGVVYHTVPGKLPSWIFPKGLEEERMYTVKYTKPADKSEPLILCGKTIMEAGLSLPRTWGDMVSVTVEIQAL